MKKSIFAKVALMSLIGVALLGPQALRATPSSQPNAAATQELVNLLNQTQGGPVSSTALASMKAAVAKGADVNAEATSRIGGGASILCRAISGNDLELAKLFTTKGGDVNRPCCGQVRCMSPLNLASTGRPEILALLQQSGAH
jgi:hypothetical protein